MKKGAMKIVFGVAAAAFLAAPLASFAGGTISREGDVCREGGAEGISLLEVSESKVLPQEPEQGPHGWR